MKKKILSILIIVLSLCMCIFTLTACSSNEPQHTHDYSTLKYDNEKHWFECECGEKNNIVAHNIKNGECICGYAVPHIHDYTELKQSATQHWYGCSCGAYETKENHIPGAEVTETTDQKCTECGYVITPALGHVHTLHLTKVDAKPQSCTQEGNREYYTCSCGKWFTNNSATTEITDKTSVVIEKDAHKYETLKKTATEHWWECSCGDKDGLEEHHGGNATCTEKAVCDDCGIEYGSKKSHSYTILKQSATQHWYECICGAFETKENHIPGAAATETTAQKCTECQYVIAPALGHVHTLHLTKVDAKPQSCTEEGNREYYTCSCGKWFTNNSATTEITDKTSVVITKDAHKYETLKKTATEHWWECICGDKDGLEEHHGGSATCTEKAVCDDCGIEYGLKKPHSYTILKQSSTQHWCECTCGAYEIKENHNPGAEATETTDQKCTECNYVIAPALGHVHTLHLTKVDAKPQSCTQEGNKEYYTCSCGKWFTNNSATTEITDKTSVVIEKDAHKYETLKKTATEHWYECTCGAYEIKENHKGGTATCQVKATCSVCDTVYGDFAEHEPKTAWVITDTHHYHECKTSGCAEKLNYAEHSFDNNKKCSGCDYVTTALLGTEISSNVYEICGTNLFVKVPNAQTTFSFAKTINVAKGATYKVYTDISCKDEYCIPSYVVNDLKEENNVYYFLVSNKDEIPQVYTVTVRRKPMYTVTFNTDGGSYVAPQTIEEDALAVKPNNPTKAGYDFVSWDYNFNTSIISDTLINAQWTINQYTLTIVYNNGQNDLVLTQDYNSDIETISNPTKIGYSFTDWDKSIPSKMPAEDMTITANWKINQYSITIVYGNGQGNKIITQDYNSNVEEIDIPERLGYTFDGWDKEIPVKMPAEDVIITANWKESAKTPYRVEYYLENLENDNYSILSSATENLTGKTNSTVYADIKTFEHFTAEKTSVSGVVAANGTTVLKVYYQRNEYTVTFNGNGGTLASGNAIQTVKYGGNVVAPTFEKEGHAFVDFNKPVINVSENCTVTANWKINQYSITIVYGSGQENKIITQDYGTLITETLPTTNEDRPGYTYAGWNNEMPVTMPAENLTITERYLAIFTLSGGQITGLTSHGKTFSKIVVPKEIDGVLITSIGDSAFYECDLIESVIFDSNSQVTNIGSSAFAYCKSLLDIEMPSSITSIGTFAFNDCNALERIVIPKSVIEMGERVFEYRYNFSGGPLVIYCEIGNQPSSWETSWNEGNYPVVWDYKNNEISADGYIYVTIDGVKYELKDNVANVCRQSSKITNANILSSINYNGVNYIVKSINKYAFRGCELLQMVMFSEDSQLEHIGEYAFDDCAKLMSVDVGRQRKSVVDLPTSLLSIGESAFSDCIAIKYIYIPDNVVEIGSQAFISCDSIKEVRIGASVSRIGDRAFYGCEAINTIRFMDTTTWYRTSNASYTNGTRTDVFSSTDSSLIKYFVEKQFYWYKV